MRWVSFFWPFRSDYWIIGLDEAYRWAVVGNPNRKYLWILSRTPTISDEVKQALLNSATRQGFDVSKFIWVEQTH